MKKLIIISLCLWSGVGLAQGSHKVNGDGFYAITEGKSVVSVDSSQFKTIEWSSGQDIIGGLSTDGIWEFVKGKGTDSNPEYSISPANKQWLFDHFGQRYGVGE